MSKKKRKTKKEATKIETVEKEIAEKKIVCSSCGASFDKNLSKCPYCETLNVPAAEAEYMEKLEDVRENLDDLQAVPTQEVKEAIDRSGRYMRRVVVIVAVVVLLVVAISGVYGWIDNAILADADLTTEEYLWQEENFPKWDTLHAEGRYEELMAEFYAAGEDGHSVMDWKNYAFCDMYDTIVSAEEHIAKDEEKGKLSMNSYSLLMREQWTIMGMETYGDFSEEELAVLRPMAEPVMEDFETRWGFTEEEYDEMYQEFVEREGYVSFDTIDAFLEVWEKRQ